MQIERLTLQNFRGYPNATFDFQPGMNLIVGVNGVGKSSVLEALRLLLSHALPKVSASKDKSFPASQNDITVGQAWLYASLRLRIERNAFEADMRVNQANAGATAHEKRKDSYRFLGAVLEENANSSQTTDQTKKQLQSNQRQLKSLPNKLQGAAQQAVVIYFSAHRSLINIGNETKREASINGQRLAFVSALAPERQLKVAQFARWWVANEALTHEPTATTAARAAKLLQALTQAVTHFLDNFTSVHAVAEPKPTLLLTKAGTTLDVRLLSDGERSVLALVLDIARRLAQANPELDDPIRHGKAVVLIDELDLHLHPRWQRTIVEKLTRTFPQCQFIATTHSPFIIQSLKSGQLINLGSQDDDVEPEIVNEEEYTDKSVEDIAEYVMGVEMPQKSVRYLEMVEVAEQYFHLLRTSRPSDEEKEKLKRELDELSLPFSDDPAYMALLKVEREITLGKEGHATD